MPNSSYVGSPFPIMKWSGWQGVSYTCWDCYQRTLTATATTAMIESVERSEVPLKATCSMCRTDLGGQKYVG